MLFVLWGFYCFLISFDYYFRFFSFLYVVVRIFFGSSSITGEGGAYFQEEVPQVAIAVGTSLDDLDGVIDTLRCWYSTDFCIGPRCRVDSLSSVGQRCSG